MNRCKWPSLENNPIYVEYHDNEWGVPSYDDRHLFKMLILESFHCGLSWLIILKKREAFKLAFDDFDPKKIMEYNEDKINELLSNKDIVRNKSKILAAISNAKAFLKVKKEFGSFKNYIWSFTNDKIIFGDGINFQTTNALSDQVSKDLKKRGFKFMGSVTTYSYLEAIGVMNNHMKECFRFHKSK
ncbi:DNA-3-methyladenine glycosylase I [Candidatus Izemoplasma sp. B36]|uniref:DNA-3-methyladenine glycosylase I n=1 Tax=Candidatus Izemoplasma sp. B36 TaxID=3242468 RepID=UPI003555F1F7